MGSNDKILVTHTISIIVYFKQWTAKHSAPCYIIRPQQINFMDDGFAASILPWLNFFIKKNIYFIFILPLHFCLDTITPPHIKITSMLRQWNCFFSRPIFAENQFFENKICCLFARSTFGGNQIKKKKLCSLAPFFFCWESVIHKINLVWPNDFST